MELKIGCFNFEVEILKILMQTTRNFSGDNIIYLINFSLAAEHSDYIKRFIIIHIRLGHII